MSEKIHERIKRLRKLQRLSVDDIVQKLGISRATYYRYENQDVEKLPITILKPLAAIFNTTPAYLMGWSEDASSSSNVAINFQPKGVQIPVLGYVIAGVPISAVEDILGYEEIPKKLADTGDFFALRIKGASMEPQFFDGDTVIVRQQSDVDDNDIAIVLVNGDEATVKQIKKSDAGITLIGFNVSVYPPHFYSNKDIESLPVSIIGKVIQVRRDY